MTSLCATAAARTSSSSDGVDMSLGIFGKCVPVSDFRHPTSDLGVLDFYKIFKFFGEI